VAGRGGHRWEGGTSYTERILDCIASGPIFLTGEGILFTLAVQAQPTSARFARFILRRVINDVVPDGRNAPDDHGEERRNLLI